MLKFWHKEKGSLYKMLMAVLLFVALMTICRLIFFVFNSSYFPDVSGMDFLAGMLFDLSIGTYLFIPFLLLSIVLANHTHLRWVRVLLKTFFLLPVVLFVVLNMIDVAYYSFTFKRMTADVINMTRGGDLLMLLPAFFVDYWYVLILTVGLIYSAYLLYNLIPIQHKRHYNWSFRLIVLMVTGGLAVLAIRGGTGMRPIGVINAADHTSPQNTGLVLNTAFTFIHSLLLKDVERESYFSDEEEMKKYFDPIKVIHPEGAPTERNVVIIILESFGKEYVGWHNKNEEKCYTPFLDSLMGESYVFTNAFANGKKSINAVPAILSGLPVLMDDPFIFSTYAGNTLWSLPEVFKEKGYHTSFFHGGRNGTMGFDAFCRHIGVQKYYGLDEFPHDNKTDGSWGVYDEPFLSFMSEKLTNEIPEPFFSTVFTLSSHHPYKIPEKYKGRFPKGSLEIHESIGYTDHALKLFFHEIKEKDWYENTVFLFTADHTAHPEKEEYGNTLGKYKIPLFVFDPDTDNAFQTDETIVQQADVPSLLLHKVGIRDTILTFGNDPFDRMSANFAVQKSHGIFQYIEDGYCLHFNGNKTLALYNIFDDPLLKNNLKGKRDRVQSMMENRLKAIIQIYQNGMLDNTLFVK